MIPLYQRYFSMKINKKATNTPMVIKNPMRSNISRLIKREPMMYVIRSSACFLGKGLSS